MLLKYTYECSSKKNNEKLCHLELDYFGFFKIIDSNSSDKKVLTENGLGLIFPFIKEIIEYITQKGGSVPITLNDISEIIKITGSQNHIKVVGGIKKLTQVIDLFDNGINCVGTSNFCEIFQEVKVI